MEKKLVFKIGFWSAVVLTFFVFCFGLCMVFGLFGVNADYFSYISSFFIAVSFICLIISGFFYAADEKKIWGLMALSFSIIYAVLVMVVYFLQVTFVANSSTILSTEVLHIVKFEPGTAVFALDLLGYAFMALATFFAGLIFDWRRKNEKWLRRLLLFHGVFFVPCLIFPAIPFATGSMTSDKLNIFGSLGYIFWCVLFSTISIFYAKLFKEELRKQEVKS